MQKGVKIVSIIFLICVISFILIIYVKKYKKLNVFVKDKADRVIPLHIYQTWHTKNIPPHMKKCVEQLKADNPEFTYHFYDDNDCRDFIKENFSSDVLYAFDKLKPGAYKADLWRYCVLYINGGIYLDIKYGCKDGFKLIELTDKEYFVRDGKFNDKYGIYNAFMVCKPKNDVLFGGIVKIVENVKNKYYGNNQLEITGPQLLQQFFTQRQIRNMDLVFAPNNGDKINYGNRTILASYEEYREEQSKKQIYSHYYDLWKNKDIYN